MDDVDSPLRVLATGREKDWWRDPGLRVQPLLAGADVLGADAIVWSDAVPASPDESAAAVTLSRWAQDTAVLLVAPGLAESEILAWVRRGVQDVLDADSPAQIARAIRLAVERKRREQAARLAYATDISTGLPHQAQLLEYLSQLVALRAREPGALVLIVLRIEGLARVAQQLGNEGAQVLRRKLAVRLRAALRASDIVASMGDDLFGVLLGHVESAADGQTVAGKLVQLLQQPVQAAGQSFALPVAVGLAQWPEHGPDPDALLQRAVAQATSAAALGGSAKAMALRPIGHAAANDEAAGAS